MLILAILTVLIIKNLFFNTKDHFLFHRFYILPWRYYFGMKTFVAQSN